jgi:selT/selW/selH-like putative selenoprotein
MPSQFRLQPFYPLILGTEGVALCLKEAGERKNSHDKTPVRPRSLSSPRRRILRKSGGGAFEITVNGKLAYSKRATGRFPTDEEVLGTLAS